jgi:undecaprenyl-diphosphatase
MIIGLSQAVAIIPGISRSGATITTGLFLGLDRISAARFSFMLSGPIIFGASILKFPEFISSGMNWPNIFGILVAAASGYLAIAGLIKFVEKVSYKIFFWYRLGLAVLIVFFYFLK